MPLTLTASDRLARALREDYSLARRDAGAAVWEAPAVQSLRQWLQDAWTGSWPAEQLLHPAQELALWRAAIERDEAGAQLLSPLAAAREARRADQLLLRHGIDLKAATLSREDHLAFARWRRELRAQMKRRDWLTPSDLYHEVARGLRQKRIRAPEHLVLAGFVEAPAAAERALFAALEDAGTRIDQQPAPAQAAHITRNAYPDAETQLRAIGLQLRARLKPFADHARPPPRLLLALPEPEARRELIETLFPALLAPWLHSGDGPRLAPWRWDAGRPLAEQPWVAAALSLCELRLDANAPALISRLLLSDALWTGDERLAASAADYWLREQGYPRIRLQRLLEAVAKRGALLLPRVAALMQQIETAPERALPSSWAAHYQARLDAIGWPGTAPLDSTGYQEQREWERLLTRLSAMDAQIGHVASGEALTWLRELARSGRFTPRVEHAQPITILSLEDAAGLPCDGLYLADLSAAHFPGSARPTPYLPLELQAAAGVPGAAPAQTLEQAQRLAAHLSALAPEVQLSYAAVDERGADTLPSPLFGALESWTRAEALTATSGLDRRVYLGPLTTLPAADPVPPVHLAERATLRSGSSLFQAWFESPFFAFCRHRLRIDPLPRPTRGLDARRQGEVAHAVLQTVWHRLQDSAQLAAVDDDFIAALITGALDPALADAMPALDYGRVQVQLERARQADVLAQWMAHERKRIDPFSVTHLEAEVEAAVGGLALKLRIDRIDRVQPADGRERWLVLDYKTGRYAEPRGWNAEKLAEPQLPLYASHAVTDSIGVPQVDGICFGHLKDGHPAFVAQTDWRKKLIEGELVDLRFNWDETLALWRLRLAEAAQAFLAGEAGLAPKTSERSYYADLLLLAGSAPDEEEDEA